MFCSDVIVFVKNGEKKIKNLTHAGSMELCGTFFLRVNQEAFLCSDIQMGHASQEMKLFKDFPIHFNVSNIH